MPVAVALTMTSSGAEAVSGVVTAVCQSVHSPFLLPAIGRTRRSYLCVCIIHMLVVVRKTHLKKGKRIPPHHPKSTRKKGTTRKEKTYVSLGTAQCVSHRFARTLVGEKCNGGFVSLPLMRYSASYVYAPNTRDIKYHHHHHQSLSSSIHKSPIVGSSDDKHTFIPNRRNTNRRRVDLEIFRFGQRSRGNSRGDFEGC